MHPLTLSTSVLDVKANRQARKYGRREQLRRILWMVFEPLFRWSPRPCFGWRRFVLRAFGAAVERNVHIYNTARIYFPWNLTIGDFSAIGEEALIYNLGRVTIGRRVTISHRAHLCAGSHDYTFASMPLLKPPITIADGVWICADAFIGPGVHVRAGAIVGARAVVTRDVDPWTIVAGNPATFLKTRPEPR
jgi:putative colanic acid biosynthesis acetyltransferase WcaF